ncbi:serine protease [Arsukibacterium ikkense]|uniref:Serine protease n=1 Tax=Arsukibacterium ikkense TaxID=336831 RepID=A0A0M2V7D6_9GAMM|nr:S8 family serine peptidase [Arsukibacterium ikkense]KKO46324.1 serine protease [Arsukibacterium ikkense]
MRFHKLTSKTAIAVVIALGATISVASHATSYEINVDRSMLSQSADNNEVMPYIVQVKGKSGVEKAEELGELLPSAQYVSVGLNRYNANSARLLSYTNSLKDFHQQLAAQSGSDKVIYSYIHTFNGFSARMTAAQAETLRNHPHVVGVWRDEAQQLTTSNTPAFLGLTTGPDGLHVQGIRGEGVVIGVVDSGIWPEHPSFADDGSYAPIAGWAGSCDSGEDANFSCNNKLIGARYFKASFESVYNIQPGEFISPRDADNHGTHVASTAAGNAGVTADLNGIAVATVSGIAPRARIAAYKACWNSSYVSPEGVNERGCFGGDTMAAIDQAVADGVDIINYSISGSLTNITTPQAAAKLRAAQAGVFVSVSAGNSGPAASTVGTPAPWVTSVAASTYTGTSVANGIEVLAGPLQGVYRAVEGATSTPLSETGDITADLVVASPLEACAPLVNSAELAGKLALMQRGSCAFDVKLANAQAAGAAGVIMYNNSSAAPIAMGGTGSFTIPAVMTTLAAGSAFNAEVTAGGVVTVRMSPSVFVDDVPEVGNLMAGFSSRGPNQHTFDVIKPDITAPGVKILAGASAQTMFGVPGTRFTYLQGTSMSSPHIAGIAALVKEVNPGWSAAMIKSAIMTTARQNLTKENGVTPADPFDFGAGHAVPNSAINPGLTYPISNLEYFAFLCGTGATAFVQTASGFSCDAFVAAGYRVDPSQLNLPSIAIAELAGAETLQRRVTDVSGSASVYTATIEAPAGVTVTIQTNDGNGNTMSVPANGTVPYAITFTPTAAAVLQQWQFGAITWSNGVHSVRSPIAVKVVPPQLIVAPEQVTGNVAASSGRVSFPVQFNYSGLTSSSKVGLTAPFGSGGVVLQDPDSSFTFNEPGLGFHTFLVPAGTRLVRFSLFEALADVPGADLDMYVYRCIAFSCTSLGSSANDGGDEEVTIRNPVPAANGAAGDFYLVFVHGYSLFGAAQANYTMPVWVVNADASNSRLSASTRAISGRSNNVTLTTSGLTVSPFPYLGVASFYDADGNEQTTTMLEIIAR